MNKQQFWDSLRLRYNLQGADLPSHCACGDLFTVSHAPSCKTRSSVAQRHDDIRNLLTSLLSKVCKDVEIEPHLLPIDNKVFNLRSMVTSPTGLELTLANSQNASDFDNLRVRKISTSKRLRVRIIHVSQTKGNNLLVVSPVC